MYVDVHVGTLASKQACLSGAYLLVRSTLHLRSQALETLSRLTDANEELDWLNTADHETAGMHVCMHACMHVCMYAWPVDLHSCNRRLLCPHALVRVG